MEKNMYYVALLVMMGCSVAVTWKYFQYNPAEDFPSKDEILTAIENGASNLTVNPMTVSDN